MNLKAIGYWVTTAIIEFELLVGGITDVVHGRAVLVAGEPVVDIVAHLCSRSSEPGSSSQELPWLCRASRD